MNILSSSFDHINYRIKWKVSNTWLVCKYCNIVWKRNPKQYLAPYYIWCRSGTIPSTLFYHHCCLEHWVLWLLFILVCDTQTAPWWPVKVCKNFHVLNTQDSWKTHFKSRKHWKYILWNASLTDNALGIELWQLQWNINYWNGKDGRLSFETQLKIAFLPPNNGSKKSLKKSCHCISSGPSLL